MRKDGYIEIDRRTNMTKLIVAFYNFPNETKNLLILFRAIITAVMTILKAQNVWYNAHISVLHLVVYLITTGA